MFEFKIEKKCIIIAHIFIGKNYRKVKSITCDNESVQRAWMQKEET